LDVFQIVTVITFWTSFAVSWVTFNFVMGGVLCASNMFTHDVVDKNADFKF